MEKPLLNVSESAGGNNSLQSTLSMGGVGAEDTTDQSTDIESITTFSIPQPSLGKGDIENTRKTGTIFGGCLNLSNTVMGAGILSLPYAVSQIGYGMAIILFILFAILTFCSLHLNMAMSRCVPNASYYTLAEAINRPNTKLIIDIAVIIGMLSAATSYLIIIGDVMPSFCHHFFPVLHAQHADGTIFTIGSLAVSQRAFWTFSFLIVLIIPLVALKNMSALRHSSLFAIFCFAFITFVMVGYVSINSWDPCVDVPEGKECKGTVMAFLDLSQPVKWLQFFEVTPFYLLAFGCAQNTLPISNEMHNRTLRRLNFVLLDTLSFVVCIYGLVGLSGYFTYGDLVKPNILKLYPRSNITALVRLCMAICVAFSYPLVLFPARRSLSTLIFKCNPKQLSAVKFYGITYPIKEYVFPAYTFMMLEHHKLEQDKWNNAKKKFAHVLFWFGLLLIPFCLTMVFIDV
eukprot:1127844_1